jgi:hypothetical protein
MRERGRERGREEREGRERREMLHCSETKNFFQLMMSIGRK